MMLTELFADHIKHKYGQFLEVLEDTGWQHLLISSGEELMQFRDDMHYPFKVNPYFKEWLPLLQHPNYYLLVAEANAKPTLFVKRIDDYWHTAPPNLPSGWDRELEVRDYTDEQDLLSQLPKDHRRTAYIGADPGPLSYLVKSAHNPPALISRIDWLRAVKTPYEIACIRESNKIAARGHVAAEQAFRAGKSELSILMAFLVASNCSENDLPYAAIVALNDNSAVLHHKILQRQAPQQSRSFLIDAGVDCNGYASDITRTYAHDENSIFAALIRSLDVAQQQICATVQAGVSYVDLHRDCHQRVAKILVDAGVLNCGVECAMQRGLTTPFLPHGLGHFLGVQVHDKGGHQAAPSGGVKPPPAQYPHLRLTRSLQSNQVLTIEPGIYFIPSLLALFRAGQYAQDINWSLVDKLTPYGGIRIEDNLVVGTASAENLTRNAFFVAQMSG